MSTLYVSDLDGTLLQPDARLSTETVSMLNAAIAEGKHFTVATARTPATVSPILQGVEMRLPAIVMTGAALWNAETGHYSRLRLFNPEDVKRLVEVYRSTGTPGFVYFLENDLITIRHIGFLSPIQQEFLEERLSTPFKRIEVGSDGESVFPDPMENVVLLYSMLPNDLALSTYEKTRTLPGVRAQYYHDIYGEQTAILEAFSPEATKAKAMKALAREIGADRIVAFGDNINDLPMMREADLAVAVANARPEVLEAADIVIGPNTENAVAKFILDH